MSKSKGHVVVAMSGGVDSSVSAALLVEQGYHVTGLMLRLWSEPGQRSRRDNRCCTRDQMIDAHFVAKKLGIPFAVVDARETFKREIVDLFIDGYQQGSTPNPCLACNRKIRFTFLLDEALRRGATHLATGHYAQVKRTSEGRFELHKGVDSEKDQSYVLSVLDQRQLGHALFPVGGYSKPEVRELAARYKLPIASKGDSQDLCFVADGDYRRFLREFAPESFVPGAIMTRDGQHIGEHQGLANYTIGQRKGLGVTGTEPLYVMAKDPHTNALVVGAKHELGASEFHAIRVNWISGEPPSQAIRLQVKVRYKAHPVLGTVTPMGDLEAHVCLESQVPDIAPGQGAVFYDGDRVVGGGLIAGLTTSVEQSDEAITPQHDRGS